MWTFKCFRWIFILNFCDDLIPMMCPFINARMHRLQTIYVLSKSDSHSPLLSQYHLGLHMSYWLTKSVRNWISLLLQSSWGTKCTFQIHSDSIETSHHWQSATLNPFVWFSLTSEATEESVINADTEMESVWSTSSKSITLWCNTKEVRGQPLLSGRAWRRYRDDTNIYD